MTERTGPDGTVYRFPAGMSDAEADAIMARKFPAPAAEPAPAPAAPPAPEARGRGILGGAFDAFTDGAAVGWGGELEGAVDGVMFGKMPGQGYFNYSTPAGERYDANREAFDANRAQFSEERPVLSGAANVAGALGTGLGMGRAGLTLMRGGGSVGSMTARGAAEGGLYGAAYGAGEADPGSRLEGAATGFGFGAATGGALSGAMAKVGQAIAGRRAGRAAPSVGSLKQQAGAAYDRARAVNPGFDGFDDWVMQAYRVMPEQGYHPNLHPQLKTALDRVEELSRGGTKPALKDLEQLRRLIATPAASGTTNPEQARLGMMLRDSLDTFMERAAGEAAGSAGNLPALAGPVAPIKKATQAALRDVQEGRKLWSRAKKGEIIERAFLMAEDRAASTNSGGNVENAIRQNVRRILDNPKTLRKFDKSEQEAMRRLVRGEPVQNVLRGIGNMSPLRGGLMSLLMGGMGGAGIATANPFLVAPAGIAAVSDALARAGTRSQAQAVSSMVRGGPNATAIMNRPPLTEAQKAMVRALSAQSGRAPETVVTP